MSLRGGIQGISQIPVQTAVLSALAAGCADQRVRSAGEERPGVCHGPSEDLAFTVTLGSLTADDAGKYRCGGATILKEEGLLGFLPDPFFQVQVIVSPGKTLLFSGTGGEGI